jgi:adenylate kinase
MPNMPTENPTHYHRHRSRDTPIPYMLLSLLFLLVLFLLVPTLIVGLNDKSPQLWGRSRQRLAFSNNGSHSSRLEKGIESRSQDYSKVEVQDVASLFENAVVPKQTSPREVSHPPRFIIIGGPASGKGTQCENIASRYGIVHLSTGDMLREAVKDDSAIGLVAKQYMDRGELVPDEVIIEIVGARLDQDDCRERGWLLDGFPRTKAQAEHLAWMGIKADVTLLLNVPDSELIERVVGRRIDPVTGKIYHLKFRPPPPEAKGRLEQRSDDAVHKMKRRLKQFHENLSQIRSFLADSLVEVDGSGAPDLIARHIAKVIDLKVTHRIRV